MRSAIKAGVAVAIAATMGLMAGVGTASASTTAIQLRVTAEAHAAGISVAKADKLQQEVTSFIRAHGGTQAALNVVDFSGGSITFAVPGEKYARDLATTDRPLAAATACNYNAFCAYNATYYGGDEVSAFYNCKYLSLPNSFSGEGSYISRLPIYTSATWYDKNYKVLYVTPGTTSSNPEVANPEVNWAPVWYIRAGAC
jgi:hypothetical protein